ncbi:MAG TPA: hypothetical protein VN840_13840 [Streptosporangiaceae bacterium]|nr:hypothetical protein [Streptosporangiaceae bacterium]
MTDPIAAAARAAAGQLTASYGPGLAADVEAALHAKGTQERPTRYLDPVSIAGLIVAIATLAWTIYNDQRKETPAPSPDTVARAVRVELRTRNHTDADPAEQDKITSIVVTEIIRHAGE